MVSPGEKKPIPFSEIVSKFAGDDTSFRRDLQQARRVAMQLDYPGITPQHAAELRRTLSPDVTLIEETLGTSLFELITADVRAEQQGLKVRESENTSDGTEYISDVTVSDGKNKTQSKRSGSVTRGQIRSIYGIDNAIIDYIGLTERVPSTEEPRNGHVVEVYDMDSLATQMLDYREPPTMDQATNMHVDPTEEGWVHIPTAATLLKISRRSAKDYSIGLTTMPIISTKRRIHSAYRISDLRAQDEIYKNLPYVDEKPGFHVDAEGEVWLPGDDKKVAKYLGVPILAVPLLREGVATTLVKIVNGRVWPFFSASQMRAHIPEVEQARREHKRRLHDEARARRARKMNEQYNDRSTLADLCANHNVSYDTGRRIVKGLVSTRLDASAPKFYATDAADAAFAADKEKKNKP